MAVKARRASAETRAAYSSAELRSAVDAMDEGEISKSLTHLVQSLRIDGSNQEAVQLLRSTLERYPIPKLLNKISLHDRIIRDAFFFSAGEGSVVVTERGYVLFHDSNGNRIGEAIELGGTNQRSALSSDKQMLAVANAYGDVDLIRTRDRKRIELQEEGKDVGHRLLDVVFSPEGRHLCVATSNGSLKLWNPSSGELRWETELGEEAATAVVFSNQGKRLIVAGTDGIRRDFDSMTGEELPDIVQEEAGVDTLVPSGSGFRYYTVSKAGEIAAVDAGRDPRKFMLDRVTPPISIWACEPERRLTAYGGRDEITVMTVDGVTKLRRFPLPDPPTRIVIHPERTEMVVGTEESGIHIWNYDTKRLLFPQISGAKNVDEILLDVERNQIRCITRDATLRVYQLPKLESISPPRRLLPAQWADIPLSCRNEGLVQPREFDLGSIPEIENTYIRAGGISLDGAIAFGAYRDGFIRLWNIASGELTCEIPTITDSVRCVDLSPDGSQVAYRDKFGVVSLFNLASKTKSSFQVRHQRDISAVAFSPSGHSFASASDDGTARIWDIRTGEPLTDWLRHEVRGETPPHFCQYSPSGEILITWSESDNAVRLWDTATGDAAMPPIILDASPRYAQIHKDGSYISVISQSEEEVLLHRVWSLKSLNPVSPEQEVKLEALNLSSKNIPDSTPFAPGDLDRIAKRIEALLKP